MTDMIDETVIRILHIYRQPGPDGAQEALELTRVILAALQAEAAK